LWFAHLQQSPFSPTAQHDINKRFLNPLSQVYECINSHAWHSDPRLVATAIITLGQEQRKDMGVQIDHLVMAITSVGAKVWHTAQAA
jgi:hypothetical protein